MALRVSLSIIPFCEPSAADPYRRTFELCRMAEDLGFDTAMIGHHHFSPTLPSDPFLLLTAVAARTSSIRVATAVFLLAVHHPLRVAEQVALVDQISGGRMSFGVGLGWNALEYRAFGSDIATRGARLEEALTILRHVWTHPEVAHAGRFHTIPAVRVEPRPVQRPHPPIWVAGVAARAIDRAARLGDAWICDPVQTEESIGQLLSVYRAACVRSGRQADWILRRYVWLGSRRELEDEWLPGFVADQLAYWRQSAEGQNERRLFEQLDRGEQITPRDIARGRFLGGAPGDVIEQIGLLRAATGIEHLSIGFGGGLSGRRADLSSAAEYEAFRSMVERFGREVLAHLE